MQDEIELLHMILKNCFGNIFVIDKDANIVYVNDNAANALRLPAEELMRMSAYELLDRKLASSVAALKVLETKQEHIQAVTFANGNTMAVNARPVFDENGDINPACEEAVMNELRGHFRPEFLNRLDEIIMFKPLTKDNIGNIINLLMNDLNKRLADREITVELSDSARQFIVDHGYDPIYGARPLKRFLQKHVETLSAKLILADEVREGDTILIDTEGDKLTARVK